MRISRRDCGHPAREAHHLLRGKAICGGPVPELAEVIAPQHLTAPPFVKAQVCSQPTETDATPLVRPVTSTVAGLSEVVNKPLLTLTPVLVSVDPAWDPPEPASYKLN